MREWHLKVTITKACLIILFKIAFWSSLEAELVKNAALSQLWLSRSRIPCGHCCGAASVSGLRISTCHRCTKTKRPAFILLSLSYLKEKKKFCTIDHCIGNDGDIYIFFLLFRAVSMAYGGSQARSPFGATAAGLHHSCSNTDPSHVFNLHHSSPQRRILIH